MPRHKPPYPFQVGLFGLPTLINNVETLWWVRDIVEKGANWWNSHGRNDRRGLRSYSVSGRVNNPGMKLAPAGITVRQLIDEFCGGMAEGHTFRAYLPGGASGGILPASMDDIPLDFGTLEKYGCFIGSAAVIILSDQDDVRGADPRPSSSNWTVIWSKRAPARPSGKWQSARAVRSRICAIRPSRTTGPTAIAAPAWWRSRASACSPPPASARRASA